ncbi:MAG TPA: transposase, partial [Acetobacteraceae bacterium]|nr:transposase [Acetobacteraceae bacterium]
RVTQIGGRKRAGCMAHARRKFHEALATAPEAQTALDSILAVYRVEHDALADGVVRTDEHLAMRQARSRPILKEMKSWMEEQQPLFPPKGPMGKVIAYALTRVSLFRRPVAAKILRAAVAGPGVSASARKDG